MIKRAYLANGTLLKALSSKDTDVYLSTDLGTLLLSLLNSGDFCFLTIEGVYAIEVIRVYRTASGLYVDRGQDNTTQGSFPAATTVKYRLTTAEIVASVNPMNYSIYASGYGVAVVDSVDGVDTISVPYPSISVIGGLDATITVGNTVELTDKNGAFGCCDSSLTGAPGIDGPFFYLTSQLYPYDFYEVLAPNPRNSAGETYLPFNPAKGLWLLDQPFMYEQLSRDMQVSELELFGGSKSYTLAESYLNPSVGLGDINIYGGQKFYTYNEGYLSADMYPLEMQLFGNAIVYNRYIDAYLAPTITLSSLELI